jgi:hypothetical protein
VINYLTFVLTIAGIYSLLGLGLVTIWGQGGMVNLGLVGLLRARRIRLGAADQQRRTHWTGLGGWRGAGRRGGGSSHARDAKNEWRLPGYRLARICRGHTAICDQRNMANQG